LQFFNHGEGYVKHEIGKFDYIYQYKDHLGNVRVSYTDADDDGFVDPLNEIIEESNYYPFGLKHKGYNEITTSSANSIAQKEKTYQGQRFTDDLGLNMHEWRYRTSDPTIGRFWQIDPLSEEYVYNSTYAFQENKMGMGVELEGLELGNFPTPVRNIGDGIARSTETEINEVTKTTQPYIRGTRDVAREISKWSGRAEVILGVVTMSSAGAAAPFTIPAMGITEAVGTVADVTSLFTSVVLLEEEEILVDAVNLFVPSFLNNVFLKSAEKSITKEITDQSTKDAAKAGANTAKKILEEPIKKGAEESIREDNK
jgi:RHS repeat-associated protein